MKELRIVTLREMGDMALAAVKMFNNSPAKEPDPYTAIAVGAPLASVLNVRFTSFVVRLAQEEGIDPSKMVSDARRILSEAEIVQEDEK